MAHMQPQITVKQRGWKVETDDGTQYVPGEVVSVPACLLNGAMIEPDRSTIWGDAEIFEVLRRRLSAYVEGGGNAITYIEVLGPCYFYRLSAPGYLDCTSWGQANTIKDARVALRELEGE
jgi:hypothetical protein